MPKPIKNAQSLLISGAGDLSHRIVSKLKEYNLSESTEVTCETRTGLNHPQFEELGFKVKTPHDDPISADSLIIAFPPSQDYAQQVSKALEQWNGTHQALLISSTGVYEENSGGDVDEESPVKKDSPLIKGEELAMAKGAHVIRLAGLYCEKTGPHFYWQNQGRIIASKKGLVNLIHREDASDFCAKILLSSLSARYWILSDGTSLTRDEIVQSWAQQSKQKPPTFLSAQSSVDGKNILPQKSWELLSWEPQYKSFKKD